MDKLQKTHSEKKKETEEFFKNAFCVEKVEMLLGEDLSDFDLTSIIKLVTSKDDTRPDFYIAIVSKKP